MPAMTRLLPRRQMAGLLVHPTTAQRLETDPPPRRGSPTRPWIFGWSRQMVAPHAVGWTRKIVRPRIQRRVLRPGGLLARWARLAFVADDGRDPRHETEEIAADVHVVRPDQGEGYTGYGTAQVWVAELDRSNRTTMRPAACEQLTTEEVWYGDPQWSPDGRTLVVPCQSNRRLRSRYGTASTRTTISGPSTCDSGNSEAE